MNMEYLYCILPGGNSEEFSELDQELCNREVRSDFWALNNGGRIYRISTEEVDKLPADKKGPYLGTSNSGHSIYKMPDPSYNDLWAGNGWHSIY